MLDIQKGKFRPALFNFGLECCPAIATYLWAGIRIGYVCQLEPEWYLIQRNCGLFAGANAMRRSMNSPGSSAPRTNQLDEECGRFFHSNTSFVDDGLASVCRLGSPVHEIFYLDITAWYARMG